MTAFRAAAMLLLVACSHSGSAHTGSPSASPAAHRAMLEIVRVDDTIDPLQPYETQASVNETITVIPERAPVGLGKTVTTHYATVFPSGIETNEEVIARLRHWLDRVTLPAGAHFGFQNIYRREPATQNVPRVALRSLVLSGESFVHPEDIADAVASDTADSGTQAVHVLVSLTPEAAKRLEQATREWTDRRFAIVVDGTVVASPIVRSAMVGGFITVPVGPGDEKDLAEAKRLARDLRPVVAMRR